uniref:Putative glycine rich protein n=1 Tax=Ixodes ricinus TaxID=34613 RepID=A0A0K8RG69_IXORI
MKATIAVLCFLAAVALTGAQGLYGGHSPCSLGGMEGGGGGAPASQSGQAGAPFPGREEHYAPPPGRK